MKIMSLFICFFCAAISLHAASAPSAFKSVGKKTSRQLELEKVLDSLVLASEEYKKSMPLYARERAELRRFGIETVASSDPELAQNILKNSRDEFDANKRLLLLNILKIPHKDTVQTLGSSSADLVCQLIARPSTPESEDIIEGFWRVDESIKIQEKAYKIPAVFPDISSSGCSLQ